MSIAELEEIRRSQILLAALTVMSRKGSFDATMDDIATAAGLSKGGLAHYYKSKNELFIAAFREFFARVFERCRESMAKAPGPLEKLLAFDLLFDPQEPYVPLGYPILFDCMAKAAHDADYGRVFGEWVEGWIALLSEALRLGVEQGLFRPLDPDPIARAVSAIYQGVATRWFLAPARHSRDWAVNAVKEAITRLMEPYILRPQLEDATTKP